MKIYLISILILLIASLISNLCLKDKTIIVIVDALIIVGFITWTSVLLATI